MENFTIFRSLSKKNAGFEPETYKFYELIDYLKSQRELNLQIIYLKNLDLLKESLKIERQVPDLERLENMFKEIFMSK